MTQMSLRDISDAMKQIDICMMTTKTASGALESRPMSNNREVAYDGDAYFFADGSSSAAREIEADAEVCLSFQHEPALLGKPLYLSVTGKGRISRDREEMKQHWVKDVEMWFKDGIDTPGLVLIHVKATRIKYWKDYQEGEVRL